MQHAIYSTLFLAQDPTAQNPPTMLGNTLDSSWAAVEGLGFVSQYAF